MEMQYGIVEKKKKDWKLPTLSWTGSLSFAVEKEGAQGASPSANLKH